MRQITTVIAVLGSAFSSFAATDIQILPCDQPVKSPKRGLCLNKMDRADFMAVAPGVSWWYNWHYKDTQNAPAEAKMEFLPDGFVCRIDASESVYASH